MHFVILADRPAHDLYPICENLSPALLPIAGRPIIEHILAAVAVSGGGRVDVVLRDDDEQTAAHITNVQWPQNDLRIFRDRPFEPKWRLVVRGDVCVHQRDLDTAADAIRNRKPLPIGISGVVAALEPTMPLPAWDQCKRAISAQSFKGEQRHGSFLSASDYHKLVLRSARGQFCFAGMTPAGWCEDNGSRTGLSAKVSTRRRLGTGTVIGARAVVEKHVTTSQAAVIGDDCYIGAGTHLENTVVLDGTFVGSGLTLKNAIVAGHWIYDVAKDVMLRAPAHLLRPRFQ